MPRESFLTTPFVDLDAAEVSVSPFTDDRGEVSVVLQLGGQVTIHVYDEELLGRLAEVAARGRDLLGQAGVAEPQLVLANAEAEA